MRFNRRCLERFIDFLFFHNDWMKWEQKTQTSTTTAGPPHRRSVQFRDLFPLPIKFWTLFGWDFLSLSLDNRHTYLWQQQNSSEWQNAMKITVIIFIIIIRLHIAFTPKIELSRQKIKLIHLISSSGESRMNNVEACCRFCAIMGIGKGWEMNNSRKKEFNGCGRNCLPIQIITN